MGSTLPQHSTLPAQATDGRGLSSATERVIDADATERDSVTLMLPPRVPGTFYPFLRNSPLGLVRYLALLLFLNSIIVGFKLFLLDFVRIFLLTQ